MLAEEHMYKPSCEPDCNCQPRLFGREGGYNYCHACKLFAPFPQQVYNPTIRESNASQNLKRVLHLMQGIRLSPKIIDRFDSNYLEEIKTKCAEEYSLKSIHDAMRCNNDHRYCNYVYILLTGQSLCLRQQDQDRICYLYAKCTLSGDFKRLPVVHVITVLADIYSWDYIRPFLYSPIKLSQERYNQIKIKWESEW